jgi:hypothetical protein
MLDQHRIRSAHDLTDQLDRIPARGTIVLGVVRGRGSDRRTLRIALLTASRPQTAPAAAASRSPRGAMASSPPADTPSSLTALAPATIAADQERPPKPDPPAPFAQRLEEPRLNLPRALVDRIEQLERRLEKLESFPRPPAPTAADRQISAARAP